MTVLEHRCGGRVGLRVVIGPTYYIGTWIDLVTSDEVHRCPCCLKPLREAYQAHELREMRPDEVPE